MSVLLIVRPKCTLAASHAYPLVSLVNQGEYAHGTGRQTVATLEYFSTRAVSGHALVNQCEDCYICKIQVK